MYNGAGPPGISDTLNNLASAGSDDQLLKDLYLPSNEGPFLG